jgi:outer membrane protein assembly factor BamB
VLPALALAVTLAACQAATDVSADGIPPMRWQVPGVGWPVTPSVDGTRVYFGSKAHEVVAVDKASGQVAWRRATDVVGLYTIGYNTTVAGSVVALSDLDVYAFDRATGARRWVYSPADGDEPGRGRLASDGARIYAGTLRGRVVALDAESGRELWVQLADTSAETSAFDPAVGGEMVFTGFKRFAPNPPTGGVIAVDRTTGTVLWKREFLAEAPGQGSGCTGDLALSADMLFASAEDGRVYALDRATGAVRWTAPRVHALPPEGPYNDHRPVVLASGILVVGSTNGTIVGLDAATGAQRWRAFNDGSVSNEITSDGVSAFVVHGGGELVAYDVETGRVRWRTGSTPGVGGDYWPAPRPDGGSLYAPGKHGFSAFRL